VKKTAKSIGSVSAIIGAQWGDEGKGKVTDIIAGEFDVIARACGGANAGHTIVVGGKKFVFHLLPSGALHPGKEVVIGSGMVVHLPTLLEEISVVEKAGIGIVDRLFISDEAHILFDYHRQIDGMLENWRAEYAGQAIGTTGRGIGPAYMEKARRSGIRMGSLRGDIRSELESAADGIRRMFGITVDRAGELRETACAAERLGDRITDTVALLHQRMSQGKKVLMEGAQGTLLDIDHGTYPYVTSSATTAAGVLQGLGVPPLALTSCIGVLKAYCTRVGSGAFPAEADAETAQRIRERGGEYGATTGRPRRCGWLSISDLRRAHQLNGFTHWNLTKIDVLDEEERIPVAMPAAGGRTTFEMLPGWHAPTKGIRSFSALPREAQSYVSFIEEQTGVPVAFIGTGPGREEMIVRLGT